MPVDLIDLSVAEATARIRSGDVSRDEYFDAYREAAAADPLNAFLWTAEDPPGTRPVSAGFSTGP